MKLDDPLVPLLLGIRRLRNEAEPGSEAFHAKRRYFDAPKPDLSKLAQPGLVNCIPFLLIHAKASFCVKGTLAERTRSAFLCWLIRLSSSW